MSHPTLLQRLARKAQARLRRSAGWGLADLRLAAEAQGAARRVMRRRRTETLRSLAMGCLPGERSRAAAMAARAALRKRWTHET
jgi:hypothetical protein